MAQRLEGVVQMPVVVDQAEVGDEGDGAMGQPRRRERAEHEKDDGEEVPVATPEGMGPLQIDRCGRGLPACRDIHLLHRRETFYQPLIICHPQVFHSFAMPAIPVILTPQLHRGFFMHTSVKGSRATVIESHRSGTTSLWAWGAAGLLAIFYFA